MLKKIMMLFVAALILGAFVSCDMTGPSSQAIGSGAEGESFVDSLSDFSDGGDSDEFAVSRSIYGIGETRATADISAYLDRWFETICVSLSA